MTRHDPRPRLASPRVALHAHPPEVCSTREIDDRFDRAAGLASRRRALDEALAAVPTLEARTIERT
jgi:hypothetical protein